MRAKVFLFSFVLFFVFSLFVVAPLSYATTGHALSLNNRTRVMAVDVLKRTRQGQELISVFGGVNEIFSEFVIDDLGERQLDDFFDYQKKLTPKIIVNAEFLAAGFEYYSWMLAQALSQEHIAQIEDELGIDSLIPFVEESQIAFLMAQMHWYELGSPNHLDPAYNENNEDLRNKIAVLQGSVSDWDKLYKRNLTEFLARVKERHIRKGLGERSLDDLIEGSEGAKKEAATRVKAFYLRLQRIACTRGAGC